jgi:hypothetical protein
MSIKEVSLSFDTNEEGSSLWYAIKEVQFPWWAKKGVPSDSGQSGGGGE